MTNAIEALKEARGAHLERLMEWLRIPSVSTDPAHKGDVRRAGEFIRDELGSSGFDVAMTETPGHPIVTANWTKAPGKPTLLVYGHYDVQPPDPLDLWRHGPFEPTLEGSNLVARGATDDKGQCFALVRGISGMLQAEGSLPVNVKFLIEGEEEIGSPNLENYIRANADALAADVVLISDTSQWAPGVPALTVSLRGLVYLQVNLVGPNRDLHSGSFGGSVENPGHALCQMMSALKDANGRITIPGFYDDVRELSDDERAAMRALPFDEEEYRKDLDVPELVGEKGYSAIEHKASRPTLDINGLLTGWTGEGAKTVLPSKAMAKFSMRLVPNQDPDKIRAAAMAHLEKLVPPGVKMTIDTCHDGAPIEVATDSPWVAGAQRAIEKGFGTAPVFIREGGSIPVVSTFKEVLGLDTILLGLGLPDDNTHSPNEKFNVDDFQRGIETVAHFLNEMAEA